MHFPFPNLRKGPGIKVEFVLNFIKIHVYSSMTGME